jgi:predicted permease
MFKSPGLLAIAVLTLAIGIGANIAIFSVVHGVLLRPLPYLQPERLVRVFTANPEDPAQKEPFSPQDLHDFRRQQSAFSDVGAYWYSAASPGKTLTGPGEPLHLETTFADSALFTTLGVAPARGGTFTASQNIPGNARVAILSDHLWRMQFGSDPNIVGKAVLLDGAPFVVVGVMPPSFTFPAPQVDVWLPLAQITDKEIPHMRQLRWIEVIGRRKESISIAQAAASSSVIMKNLALQYPETNSGNGAAAVMDLRESMTGDLRPALLALFTAVALILLMACVNLTNLLLARDRGRVREFAIRSSLGADRATLRRQALTESMMLALMGGAASFLFARGLITLMLALNRQSIPRAAEIHVDSGVVVFGAALSIAVGLLVGTLAAMRVTASRIWESLKATGTSATSDIHHRRGRSVLMVAQVALACVLLSVTALVLRSLSRLLNTDPGFRADHVLTVQLALPLYKLDDRGKQSLYRDELLRRIGSLPGVKAIGASKTLPLQGGGEPYRFDVIDALGRTQRLTPTAGTFIVTQGYFEALSIPVTSGRVFTTSDLAQNKPVAVINQSTARLYWPGEDAVGKSLDMGKDKLEVIGVVGDVHNEGLDKAGGTAVYIPSSLAPRQKLDLFIRAGGDPLAMANEARRVIHDFEPDQAINDISPLEQLLHDSAAQPRFFAAVLSSFGAVALLLAAVGIFGVISYNVRERTNEIGIRMALGAARGNVSRMVFCQAGTLLLLGIAIGLLGALVSGRLIAGLLYGVGSSDPVALVSAIALLSVVAMAAAIVPARRAMRVDPIIALRYE